MNLAARRPETRAISMLKNMLTNTMTAFYGRFFSKRIQNIGILLTGWKVGLDGKEFKEALETRRYNNSSSAGIGTRS